MMMNEGENLILGFWRWGEREEDSRREEMIASSSSAWNFKSTKCHKIMMMITVLTGLMPRFPSKKQLGFQFEQILGNKPVSIALPTLTLILPENQQTSQKNGWT